MKNLFLILCMAIVFSCNKKEERNHPHPVKETMAINPENPLNKLKYHNKVDYYCKMDVKLGVSDTVTYKGNLYGFCSKMCKEGFLEKPEEYLAKN